MNVIQALQAAFGPDALDRIDTTGAGYLDEEVHPLTLCTDEGGAIFISCGGEAFATMRAVAPASRLRFYLVRATPGLSQWRAARAALDARHPRTWTAADVRAYHAPMPRPVIRLVVSA